MYVCMYVYIYVYMYIHTYMYVCRYIYIHTHMSIHIHTYIQTYRRWTLYAVSLCMYIHMCTDINVHMHLRASCKPLRTVHELNTDADGPTGRPQEAHEPRTLPRVAVTQGPIHACIHPCMHAYIRRCLHACCCCQPATCHYHGRPRCRRSPGTPC